jgi:hypothetical protein
VSNQQHGSVSGEANKKIIEMKKQVSLSSEDARRRREKIEESLLPKRKQSSEAVIEIIVLIELTSKPSIISGATQALSGSLTATSCGNHSRETNVPTHKFL